MKRTYTRAVSTDILRIPARVVVTAADRLTSTDGRNVLERLSGVGERPMIIPMTTTGRRQQSYDQRVGRQNLIANPAGGFSDRLDDRMAPPLPSDFCDLFAQCRSQAGVNS
jgi:hypothetical protein